MTAPTYIDPGLLDFATPVQRRYCEAIELHGSARAAARALGLTPNAVSGAIERLKKEAALRGYAPDYDMTHAVPDGFKVRGVSTYYDRDGQARGQWVKSAADEERRAELFKAFVEGLKDEITPAHPLQAPLICNADLLTVYPVGDPHAGLYSWADETGSHFDLAEFERVNCQAIDRLVASVPSSKYALFNDKGDTVHADNNKNRTPRSNHELDVHGRHAQAVRISGKVKRYQIRRLLEKHEQVLVRVDPGNHDPDTALRLAELLEAIYENEPRVTVVISPNTYWYHQFGKNLIGTCHGDGAKGKDLPSIMANDVREWWGLATYCLWLVGHVHHKDIKDYRGCTVEYMRTLAAPDAWSHGAGFRSRRSLEAITLHRLGGEDSRHTVHVARLEAPLEAA